MAIWPYIMCKYIFIYIFILSRHSHTIYTVPVNGLHSALLSKTMWSRPCKTWKDSPLHQFDAWNQCSQYCWKLYNTVFIIGAVCPSKLTINTHSSLDWPYSGTLCGLSKHCSSSFKHPIPCLKPKNGNIEQLPIAAPKWIALDCNHMHYSVCH